MRKYSANLTETELKEDATARACALMKIAVEHGGVDLTDRDRDVAMLGIEFGIAACVATILDRGTEQPTT